MNELILLMITDNKNCWVKRFKRRGIKYYLCILFNTLKGYEVKEL